MRKTVAVLALGLLGIAPAQAVAAEPDTTALRNAVTRAEVLRYEQRLNAIGLSNENNRLTASQGNFESVNYVIGELRKIGYNPTLLPYANAQRAEHVVGATAHPARCSSRSRRPRKTYVNGTDRDERLRADDLEPDRRRHRAGDPGRADPDPAARDRRHGTAAGCSMSDFPAAVKDNIALVQRGSCCTESSRRSINARAAGAKAVMIMNEGQTGRTAPGTTTNGTTFTVRRQTYPGMIGRGAHLRRSARSSTTSPRPARRRRCTSSPTTTITQRIDYDIIAETPGGDPTRVLQVGAHIDGVAAGPGINDDGSGTAMNLTIAHQILKLGIPLKYKIRFGWFSGEEQGLFGSTFAVNQLNSLQTQQTLAHARLRHDRVDQLDPVHVHPEPERDRRSRRCSGTARRR